MKTKDLDIRDHHYYPDFDAFLIRAYRPGTVKRLPRAIVGWMQRTNPENLIETRSFPDIPAAMKAFAATQSSGEFPESFMDLQDLQVKKVYDWEDRLLMPSFDHEITDQKSGQRILRKIARARNIPCPKLIWADESNDSDYDSDTNQIKFGHRSLIPLLHEMAHAIHSKKLDDNDGEMHHSPGFVWHAIDLYHSYAGIDLDYLVATASKAGIIGPFHVHGPEFYIQKANHLPTALAPRLG